MTLVAVHCPETGSNASGEVIKADLVLTARHTLEAGGGRLANARVYTQAMVLAEDFTRPITGTVVWPVGPTQLRHEVDAVLLKLAAPEGRSVAPQHPFRPARLQFRAPAIPVAVAGWAAKGKPEVVLNRPPESHPGQAYLALPAGDTNGSGIRFVATARLPSAGWEGLSGGALMSAGNQLLGIVEGSAEGLDDTETVAVQPIADLLRDGDFCDLVEWDRGTDPPSASGAARDLPDGLAELNRYLPYFDRVPMMKSIRKLVANQAQPVELLAVGRSLEIDAYLESRLSTDPLRAKEGRSARMREVAWPTDVASLADGSVALARAVLDDDVGVAPSLEELCTTLAAEIHETWLRIELPSPCTALDVALLTAWRGAWRLAARPHGRPCGCLLVHRYTRDLMPDLAEALRTPAPGVASYRLPLRRFTIGDAEQWPKEILDNLQDVRPDLKHERILALHDLAHAFHPELKQRGYQAFHLSELSALLAGGG
jgi:hypothetical protein